MNTINLAFIDQDLADIEVKKNCSEYGGYKDNYEKVEARLAAGEVAIYAKPQLLLLDFDSPDELADYEKRRDRLGETLLLGDEEIFPSPSGRGFHVYLKLHQPREIPERLLMQAALGSDPLKEVLSFKKYERGGHRMDIDDYNVNPSFLLEKDTANVALLKKKGFI